MSFLVRTQVELGITLGGRIVSADDPEAIGKLPEGTRIPIDDAQRLGIADEAEERARANHGVPVEVPE